MDYKDYIAGNKSSNFWFRGKCDLINKLFSKYNNKNKLKILNLGAGTGDDLEILNKFGDVYIIDINEKALDLIPEKLYFKKEVSDACKLKYPDNFFDIVTSFDVFEHIEEDGVAVKEANRVLKKGGYLFFSVPAFQFLYSYHDRVLEHKRRYSKKALRNLFKDFKKLKLVYWNFFLFLPIAFLRFLKKDSKDKVDNANINPILDKIFFRLLKIENFLINKNFNFSFGLTIIGVFKK